MYIHIGEDYIIKSKDIISIINIDYVKNTREYKSMKETLDNNQCLHIVTTQKIKSFIITQENGINKGYLTNLSINTILKRIKKT